jgi:hypothetical protein
MLKGQLYKIKPIIGNEIEVFFLNNDETQWYLSSFNWSIYESETLEAIEGIFVNQNDEILNTNFKGKSVLFKHFRDFETINDQNNFIVLRSSTDNNRLIYHQFINEETKIDLIKKQDGYKLWEYSVEKEFDLFVLEDERVVISLIEYDGEVFECFDDYLEVKYQETL